MTSRISLNCWILHRLTLLLSDLIHLKWIPYLSPSVLNNNLTPLHLLAICKQLIYCYFYREGELCLLNAVTDFSVNLYNSIYN